MNHSIVSRALVLTFLCLASSIAYAGNPHVITASRHDTSPPFSQVSTTPSSNTGGTNSQTNPARPARSPFSNPKGDSVASTFTGPLRGVTAGVNFEGQSADDTRNLLGVAFVPPDTNGAAGARQFVQIVNVTISVYSKSGDLELGPALIHTIWTGFGGLCEFGGAAP
jgi:hypothetical protein